MKFLRFTFPESDTLTLTLQQQLIKVLCSKMAEFAVASEAQLWGMVPDLHPEQKYGKVI